jgi:hypothetical protein
MTISMAQAPGSSTITICPIGGRIEQRSRIGTGINGPARFK